MPTPPGPVTVDLTTLTATGEGTDTFAPTPAGKFTGIVGSPYDDVLTGGPADDQIHGGGGDDTITGGPGDDLVHGDLSWAPDKRNYDTFVPGDDVVEGGAGDDSSRAATAPTSSPGRTVRTTSSPRVTLPARGSTVDPATTRSPPRSRRGREAVAGTTRSSSASDAARRPTAPAS